MYVCICNAITEDQIKESVNAGAASLEDLQAELGVASCCGCCADMATSYIEESNCCMSANVTQLA